MFGHLTDLKYKRNTKEAIGFYMGYFVYFVLFGMLLGTVLAVILGTEFVLSASYGLGQVLSIVLVISLSVLVLKAKKLLGNFGLLMLLVLAGILSYFGGALLGLIITAYFTTRK